MSILQTESKVLGPGVEVRPESKGEQTEKNYRLLTEGSSGLLFLSMHGKMLSTRLDSDECNSKLCPRNTDGPTQCVRD